jgi:DNA-binding transcriptional regulator YiaG
MDNFDLAKKRLELGMTRSDLAKELGCSIATLYRWEKGITPTPKIVEMLVRGEIIPSPTPIKPTDIISVRKSLGLSMGEFAKLLGVDKSTVFHWEKGRFTPSKKIQKKIKKLVDI